MGQFQFQLDTVLSFKQQILDARMAEHGAAIYQTRCQEEVLAQARRRLADCEEEYEQRKAGGITIAEAMKYQSGIRTLERTVIREAEALERLRRVEEEKRHRVVESKKETSSLERIREIREEEYESSLKKAEEKRIDDLTMARRMSGARRTGGPQNVPVR